MFGGLNHIPYICTVAMKQPPSITSYENISLFPYLSNRNDFHKSIFVNTFNLIVMDTKAIIGVFMGWEFFPSSKEGQDGYPFGGFRETAVWILNPTELYKVNPCHYHYEYRDGNFNDDVERAELFEDWSYDLKYDTDWNWTMKVVERIESLGATVRIENNECTITKVGASMSKGYHSKTKIATDKINAVCFECAKFIEWYKLQSI